MDSLPRLAKGNQRSKEAARKLQIATIATAW